eukprot:TRINITY_DN26963_c0_g1_i1.p1 TRINITY_DN26963_c0_g1~~TRINITY_DN26963_c0_g1_i1.p1  ORF type:complete len:842 (-),score=228.32 TRINITY_DN26963_c0_g1_i1:94-2619(-)
MGISQAKCCCASDQRALGEFTDNTETNAFNDTDKPIVVKVPANSTPPGVSEEVAFLKEVPLFKRLPLDQLPTLASACVVAEYKAGDAIVKQGDAGDAFYIIKSGEASVDCADGEGSKHLAILRSGDYFGENALLRNVPRMATITATSALTTLRVSREKFRELGLHVKLRFPKRRAVGAGGGTRAAAVHNPSPKTEAEKIMLADALRKNDYLKALSVLSDKKVEQLVESAWEEEMVAGQEVITAGDIKADAFYIVKAGEFEITVVQGHDRPARSLEERESSDHRVQQSKEPPKPFLCGPGASFGELALLYLCPRAATVKAKTKATLWCIDRANFKHILLRVEESKINEYMKILEAIELFSSLLRGERREVAKAAVELSLKKGEVVFQEGDAGSQFLLTIEGDVELQKGGKRQELRKADPQKKEFPTFGDEELMSGTPHPHSLVVHSPTARILALDKICFELLLQPILESLKEEMKSGKDGKAAAADRKAKAGFSTSQMMAAVGAPRGCITQINLKDMERVGLLGCGGFGTVELWEHPETGDGYAMKIVSKGYIVKQKLQDSIMNEKNVLLLCDSIHITKLYQTYRDDQFLKFLLEACLGGDLFTAYEREGLHGSEEHARFYTSATILAFEHLHEKKVIYRDLKPENLLLTTTGQMKVTDMGLAKFCLSKTYTACGTPDYFAPELIEHLGHNHSVDWWCLGVFIYELLSGAPPFEAPSPTKTYAKILKGIEGVNVPKHITGPSEDIIRGLLKKDPAERSPCVSGGLQNLFEHPWFKGFDWEAMREQKATPPYVPEVQSKAEIRAFQVHEEDLPPFYEYEDDGSGWDATFPTDVESSAQRQVSA